MKTMLTLSAIILALALTVLCGGCGGGSSTNSATSPSLLQVWPAGGTIVTTDVDVTKTLTWAQTQQLASGTTLFLRVNRLDDGVRAYPIRFNSAQIDSNGEKLIACTVDTSKCALTVGSGDSGSPLVTADGKFIGGLRYGIPTDAINFEVAAAEDILKASAPEGQTRRSVVNRRDLGLAKYISGLNSRMIARVSGADQFFSKYHQLSNLDRSAIRSVRSRRVDTPLIAGMSVSVNEISGDILNGGAVGTLTAHQNGKIIVFSHAYNDEGDVNIPTTQAKMLQMWNGSGYGTFKEAVPVGANIGMMTADRSNGCIVDPMATSSTIAVKVNVSVNGAKAKTYIHQVAVHSGVYGFYTTMFTQMALQAPMDFVFDKVAAGASTGALTIIHNTSEAQTISFAAPVDKDGKTIASSDIVGETMNRISAILSQNLVPGESPASLELTVNLGDKPAPIVSVRLFDSKNNEIDPSTNPAGNQEIDLASGVYTVQCWASGWQTTAMSTSYSIDGDGSIATLSGNQLTVTSVSGTVNLTVTVTNTATKEVKTATYSVVANGGQG